MSPSEAKERLQALAMAAPCSTCGHPGGNEPVVKVSWPGKPAPEIGDCPACEREALLIVVRYRRGTRPETLTPNVASEINTAVMLAAKGQTTVEQLQAFDHRRYAQLWNDVVQSEVNARLKERNQ